MALALALGTATLSVSAEVYFAIEGCCGVEPQICRDNDEFEKIQNRLEPLSTEIDAKALECT